MKSAVFLLLSVLASPLAQGKVGFLETATVFWPSSFFACRLQI